MSLVGSGEATVAGILGVVFRKGGSMSVRLSEKCKGPQSKLLFMARKGHCGESSGGVEEACALFS